MTIRERLTSTARVVTAVGLCVLVALGSAVVATPASADTPHYTPVWANSSWLNLAVRDGSTAAGADIIQWWADNKPDQQWAFIMYPSDPTSTFRLRNQGSGMCMTADGVAGDPVRQYPCDPANARQEWQGTSVWWAGGYNLYSPATGLTLDVQGDSYWGGAEIDTWYLNFEVNQVFNFTR